MVERKEEGSINQEGRGERETDFFARSDSAAGWRGNRREKEERRKGKIPAVERSSRAAGSKRSSAAAAAAPVDSPHHILSPAPGRNNFQVRLPLSQPSPAQPVRHSPSQSVTVRTCPCAGYRKRSCAATQLPGRVRKRSTYDSEGVSLPVVRKCEIGAGSSSGIRGKNITIYSMVFLSDRPRNTLLARFRRTSLGIGFK